MLSGATRVQPLTDHNHRAQRDHFLYGAKERGDQTPPPPPPALIKEVEIMREAESAAVSCQRRMDSIYPYIYIYISIFSHLCSDSYSEG